MANISFLKIAATSCKNVFKNLNCIELKTLYLQCGGT